MGRMDIGPWVNMRYLVRVGTGDYHWPLHIHTHRWERRGDGPGGGGAAGSEMGSG